MKNAPLKGFTLVELMVTIVIVGVLAAIAIPSYQGYVRRTRYAEAHTTLNAMAKGQATFFLQNKEFLAHGPIPDVPNTGTKGTIGAISGNIRQIFPHPQGSQLYFGYLAHPGKNTGAGTANLGPTAFNGMLYSNGFLHYGGNSHFGLGCKPPIPSIDYVQPAGKPSYNWVFLLATADLKADPIKSDSLCTRFIKVVDTNDRGVVNTNQPIRSLNPGE